MCWLFCRYRGHWGFVRGIGSSCEVKVGLQLWTCFALCIATSFLFRYIRCIIGFWYVYVHAHVHFCASLFYSRHLPNLLFCGIHCHVYRAYLLLLRTSYPFAHPKFISDASNLFSVSPIVPQKISLRIPRARFLALGRMMKRDMKRCLLRIVSARGSISNRFDELQAIKEALTISRSAPPWEEELR